MPAKFNGVCVGGPYAGRQIVSTEVSFAVPLLPKLPPCAHFEANEPSAPDPLCRTVYRFHRLDCEIGLWVIDGMSREEALYELIGAYKRECAANAR